MKSTNAKKKSTAPSNTASTSANPFAGVHTTVNPTPRITTEGGEEGEQISGQSAVADSIAFSAAGVTRIQSGSPYFQQQHLSNNTDTVALNPGKIIRGSGPDGGEGGSNSSSGIHSPANSSSSSTTTKTATALGVDATAIGIGQPDDPSSSSSIYPSGNPDSTAAVGVHRSSSFSEYYPKQEVLSPHSSSTPTANSSVNWQATSQFHAQQLQSQPQHYSQLLSTNPNQAQPPFRRSAASGQFIVSRTQNVHQFNEPVLLPQPIELPPNPQSTFHSQQFQSRLGGPSFTRASIGQLHYQSTGVPIPTTGEHSNFPGNLWIQNDPTRLYHSVPTGLPPLPPVTNQINPFAPSHPFAHSQIGPTQHASIAAFMSGQDQIPHTLQRGASASSTSGYKCPNCSKTFARDDLLRRHLAREARAAAQPSLDRQKSCFECARSKARCDLEVPTCGRCRTRGKNCVYGARSGNPNVRKNTRPTSQELGGATAASGTSQWQQQPGGVPIDGSQWSTAGITVPSNAPHYPFPHKNEGSEEYESDDSRNWSDSYQQYRGDRTLSTSSSNTDNSFDYTNNPSSNQQNAYTMNYADQTSYLMAQPAGMGLPSSSTGRLSTGGIDTSVPRVRAEDDEQTPISRAVNAVMGPPQVTPLRGSNTTSLNTSNWSGSVPQPPNSRPEIPRLLTGARMPRPPEAGQASARPLFSAQLDLSGWLEEPVIPSPLYRMGPSLSALGANNPQFTLPTPTIATQAGNQLTSTMLPAPSNGSPGQASDSMMGASGNVNTGQESDQTGTCASQHAQVAARNWWAAGQHERTTIDSQEVAQACAGHFTLYPALMVLPDATSPVPPLFHRPWLANTRLQTPASLAQVRVALAAYHVRLPASEPMVWEMIKSQAKAIVSSYDHLVHSSDMEVFSSTAALWFLVILMLMSSDPATGQFVGEGLTDSCLVGLSHLSWLLQQRVRALEQTQIEQRRTQGAASPSFIDWGFLETMRRTLFACYALFVLQRFRPTSAELQSRLAGVELVMDVKLPATASEFEAGNELEWRAAQHVKITDDQGIALGGALTLRELLAARSAAHEQQKQQEAAAVSGESDSSINNKQQESNSNNSVSSTASNDTLQIPISEERRKQMLTYFDRHDDFTNVCLTVTFALDALI